MKVAICFLISYEHAVNKEQLWIDWIKPNSDIINVYFHYKNIDSIKSKWVRLHAIPPNLIKPTTYFNVVPAYFSVFSYAFNHDAENMWFCILTEACVPAISPANFRRLFLQHYPASIIKCRQAWWNIDIQQRANLKYLSPTYRLANTPWFILTRNHVHKCLIFLAGSTRIFRLVVGGGLANESIFAIILQTFKVLYLRTHCRQLRDKQQLT